MYCASAGLKLVMTSQHMRALPYNSAATFALWSLYHQLPVATCQASEHEADPGMHNPT